MRKIKLQMQVTADGFVCGPNGEMDWVTFNWDDALQQYVGDLTNSADTFIVGRVLYQGMSMHWPAAEQNMESSEKEREIARDFNNKPKIVFSKTLTTGSWKNTTIASGDLFETVRELKSQEGSDILLYGGVSMVSSFIQHNLIDEYHLFINPTAIGKGKSIFADLTQNFGLELIRSQSFSCGIVLLCYAPAKQ
ncbi:dihydrofolate reductase family protein [Emticicia sp. 17c]|uniref:dihydrofolate reductase family protein n=1 Tax=Emticicia sp. 17c TaxID=3127704 RepID=UPI00301D055E